MSNFRRRLMMMPLEKGYIKKGLELWLDGIQNTRNGHISNPLSTWQDLSGNNYDFTVIGGTAVTPNENNLPFAEDCVYGNTNQTLDDLLYLPKNLTIEVVCSIDTSDTNAKTIILGGSAYPSSNLGLWYRPASGGLCVYAGSSYANRITDIEKPHTYSAIFNSSSIFSTNVYQDNKLTTTSSGGTMANQNYTCIGGRNYGTTTQYRFHGQIYCIRIYNRQLTQKEREHNRLVDIERFGI